MASVLVSVMHPARHKLWHAVRGVMDIFHILPPAAAGLIFYLLCFDAQIRELYGSELIEPNYAHIALAAAGFILVSCGLYSAHHLFSRIRGNVIYANFLRRSVGRNLRAIRDLFGLVWAAAPWAGMFFGVLAEAHLIRDDQRLIGDTYQSLRKAPFEIAAANPPTLPDVWPAVVVALAAIVILASLLLFLLYSIGRSPELLYVFAGLAFLLLLAAAVIPLAPFLDFVTLYRTVGPLATLAIEILCMLGVAVSLAYLAWRSKFPAVTLVLAFLVLGALFNIPFSQLAAAFTILCFVLFLVSAVAGLVWEGAVTAMLCLLALGALARDHIYSSKKDPYPPTHAEGIPHLESVQESFSRWWVKRAGAPDQADTPYPVYIIAAQGGGIYAAAATALFLARVADRQPCFLEHVFAISGVSGGAIGATLFTALAASVREKSGAGSELGDCGPTSGTLSEKLAEIMQDDYFSPVVGAIFPDFLGETWGRAEALQRSFVTSLSHKNETAAWKLKEPYQAHWYSGIYPALVLNTTSAETGYRVAFAPFSFNTCRDRSLYAFGDPEVLANPETKRASCKKSAAADATSQPSKKQAASLPTSDFLAPEVVSLMFAAVASARFPLILPPYSITTSQGHRLNFVDGGYADNSGSETALDLYRTLKEHPSFPERAELKMILITTDDPLPDFGQISGTNFGDTIAPISAVLQVRQGLSHEAVARVCDYFRLKAAVDDDCVRRPDQPWQLGLVKLEAEAYRLPLGWKISKNTIELIKALIGDATYCRTAPPDSIRLPDVLNNSCVLHVIGESLKGRDRPAPAVLGQQDQTR